MSPGQMWLVALLVPAAAGAITALFLRATAPAERFDSRESLTPVEDPVPATSTPSVEPAPSLALMTPLTVQRQGVASSLDDGHRLDGDGVFRHGCPTTVARSDRARDNVVSVLHEMGEFAPLVRQLEAGDDLLDVLQYVDSFRATLADSNDTLQGVVRGEEAGAAD